MLYTSSMDDILTMAKARTACDRPSLLNQPNRFSGRMILDNHIQSPTTTKPLIVIDLGDPHAPDTDCAMCGYPCHSQADWNVEGPLDDVLCESCFRAEMKGPF